MHKQPGDDGWTVVTFTLPAGAAASVATLHGDFNGWDGEHHVLLPPDDGGPPELSLRLPPGRYEFRYCLDGTTWVNDPGADDYVPNPFGGQNSVVVVEATGDEAGSDETGSAVTAGGETVGDATLAG